MILCVCRGVPEREVLDAIHFGARTLEEIAARCRGAGTDCGACRRCIIACFEGREEQPASA